MTTEEDYSKLVSQLSAKESEHEALLKQQNSLMEKIKVLNLKKNSILDIISSLDDNNNQNITTEQELLKLNSLEGNTNVSDLLKLIKGETALRDIEVDPVLLKLLNEGSI